MPLRAVAIAPPGYQEGRAGSALLTSKDPASLFNVCRYAAWLAEAKTGEWGASNWATDRQSRRRNLLLMHSLKEELPVFQSLLEEVQPNLLLIGAMTICLPGAIECARLAKEMFGDRICIVLGGRHVNESMYLHSHTQAVSHHPASPLRLMSEGLIDPVFDLVVSGEGDYLIAKIGEIIGRLDHRLMPAGQTIHHLSELHDVSGRWIVGWLDKGQTRTLVSQQQDFDRDVMPVPCEMFGIRTGFNVFKGRLTAHVFSDSSSGCVYDCSFCSERFKVSGQPLQVATSADRLYRQLTKAVQVVAQDHPELRASAFAEDSILLEGQRASMLRLIELLQPANLDLSFGGQLTIDQGLEKSDLLPLLKSTGFDYLFFGLETKDPTDIGGMHKDTGYKKGNWFARAEKLLGICSKIGIRCGVSVLFGIGESRRSRQELFQQIAEWRKKFGFPEPISLNWAVQHPLQGSDGGTGYRYLDWGTPDGPLLEAFQDFGEASMLYPMAGQLPPTLDEVTEVVNCHRSLCG